MSRPSEHILSVVIPTKNRPELLKGAVGSFASFARELDVHVIDNGSSRHSSEIVSSFCREHGNCSYVCLSGPANASRARNWGTSVSRGRYIWFLDDDDTVPAGTVRAVLRLLASDRRQNEIILLPMSVRWQGSEIQRVHPGVTEQSFHRYRSHGSVVNTSCAVFPRAIIDAVGGWDEYLSGGQDTDLFLRCSKVCEFFCLETEPVCVNVAHARRFGNEVFKQQKAKLKFLLKHWGVLAARRKLKYLVGFLVCQPLLNKLWLTYDARKLRASAQIAAGRQVH